MSCNTDAITAYSETILNAGLNCFLWIILLIGHTWTIFIFMFKPICMKRVYIGDNPFLLLANTTQSPQEIFAVSAESAGC